MYDSTNLSKDAQRGSVQATGSLDARSHTHIRTSHDAKSSYVPRKSGKRHDTNLEVGDMFTVIAMTMFAHDPI
jgi:hypothetical protein